jgi:hypothetical protein
MIAWFLDAAIARSAFVALIFIWLYTYFAFVSTKSFFILYLGQFNINPAQLRHKTNSLKAPMGHNTGDKQ